MSRDVNALSSAKLSKFSGTLLNESLIQAKLYAPKQMSLATIGAGVDSLLARCRGTQEDLSALLEFAESFQMHCKREGVEDGLNAAIALHCEALRVSHALDLRSRMIDICLSIAESLVLSGRRYGAEEDAEDAVKISHFAQSISTRSNPRILAYLGIALGLRHKMNSKIEDLRGAISALRQAVDHEDQYWVADEKVSALTDLSHCLHNLFYVTGELSDLQESFTVAQRAVSTPCTTFPQHANALASLSNSLRLLFATGDHPIDILEEAVASGRLSVRHSPPNHSDSPANLLSLVAALGVRQAALGNVADLDEVSILLEDALRVNKSPRRLLPILTNLGSVKLRLCEVRENWSNTMESVNLFRQALQYCPIGHPRRVPSIANLIASLIGAHYAGHPVSLDEAVTLAREAIEILDPRHPQAATILVGLCQTLRARGSIADLDEAMPLHKRLLELLPVGSRVDINAKAEWALSLVARFKLTQKNEDWNEAWRLIDEAIENRYSSIFLRYGAALDWVKITRDIPSIDPSLKYIPIAAHRKAIALLPRLSYLGFDPHARLNALKQGRRLAVDAALIALSQDKPIAAVELLEQGRSIFWTGSVRPRAESHSLPEPLSSKISEAYKALEALGQHPPKDDGDVERRAYADKLEDLIAEARALPEHADFLLPRSFGALKAVTSEGPVVILVGGTILGEAIVLMHEDAPPFRVVLSNVDQQRLERISRVLNANAVGRDGEANDGAPQNHQVSDEEAIVREQLDIENQVESLHVEASAERIDRLKLHRDRHTHHDVHPFLRCLWDDIMGPVLASIGLHTPSANPSRVWLCPTGTFTFLPLHAAQSPSGHYALDCAVISYIPTLKNLMDARERMRALSELVDPKVLVVAQPNVPSQVALPQTLDEAAVVQALVPPPNLISLSKPGAQGGIVNTNVDISCARVMESLSDVSVLHLACHGFQEASRPLDSGFMMHDKRLTVSDLMALKLPKAQFAFLSACQSAMGDRDSPDEAIHLSAAMMFLGFGSVVATMWNMNDSDGPSLAREIYGSLFDGNRLDFAAIPRALNRAVRKLKDNGVHPSRWATYIHMGA